MQNKAQICLKTGGKPRTATQGLFVGGCYFCGGLFPMENVVGAAPTPEAQPGPPAGSPAQAALGQGVPAPPPPRGALVLLRTAASPPGHRQVLAEPPARAGTSPAGAAGSALPSTLPHCTPSTEKALCMFFSFSCLFSSSKRDITKNRQEKYQPESCSHTVVTASLQDRGATGRGGSSTSMGTRVPCTPGSPLTTGKVLAAQL